MAAIWRQPTLTLMFPTVHNSSRRKLIPSNPNEDFNRNSCFWRCWTRNRHSSKKCMFKMVLLLCMTSFVGFFMHYRIETANHFRILHQDVQHLTKHFKLRKCNFPKLKPFGTDVLPHLSKPPSVNCVQSANPSGELVFVQEKGRRVLWKVKDYDGTCCYRPFHRTSDANARSEDNCIEITQRRTEIPEEYEFIEVICLGQGDDYRDGFAFINRKPEVEEFIKNAKEDLNGNNGRMNVIILGLDATSRMNFLRMMPKSNDYLLNNLSAIVMEGYTKVAENTLPNVVPLLTGETFDDFKKRCVSRFAGSGDVHLDSCPFIWKKFAALGFHTGYAEDDVNIGIFNMNWAHAFDKEPTHYYLRPFSVWMQEHQESSDGHCYGTRLSFQVLLDNLENMAVALKDRSYFQMTWATKLSHDNFNKLSLGDIPLLSFLKFMNTSGHLNNTVIFLMSDHGSRIDAIRATPQGKVEDRMPLLYVVLPPWFSTIFPVAVANLKENSGRLTSAFDVHETLKDFLDLARLKSSNLSDYRANLKLASESRTRQPQSLFQKILENRTCFDAGIPLHWCVCRGESWGDGESSQEHFYDDITNLERLHLDAAEIQGAFQYAVDSMNYHLNGQRSCATLTLDSTTDAFYTEFDSDDDELGTLKSTKDNVEKVALLRISFVTNPGKGSFEATLLRRGVGPWKLTEQVVRTNEYGDQSSCVEQEFKPFCYCN